MARFILLIIFFVLLSACRYTSEEAKSNGDLVVGPGGNYQYEKINQFLNHIDQQKSAQLRITSYTDEGDPIISDFNFDGKKIQYSYDNSRDKFGGRNKGKSTTTCEKIEKKEVNRADLAKGIQYVLTGCQKVIGTHESGSNEIHILFVPAPTPRITPE